MRSRRVYILLVAVVSVLMSTSAQAQSVRRDSADFELGRTIEILANMMREFDMNYVERVSPDKLLSAAVMGITKATDPYSHYLSEKDMAEFDILTTGKYGGVGSTIRKSGDYIIFAEPYKGSPADEAGIKSGDKIIAINGKSMKGESVDVISDNLKGDPETDVEVTLERFYDSKVESVTIRRRRISIPSVTYSGIVRDGVGYIAHNDFIRGSYEEVRRALEQLQSKAEGGLKGLVLDYRSNGGGVMREAIDIASLFVDSGERIVSIMGRDSSSLRHFTTQYSPIARDLPIVILVNSSSASASEILAGSLQDMDRAVVMGQRTYGKGLVQSTSYVGYNAYLKYTTEKYYIPSGRCIQAHDYSSRKSDGSIGSVPDSLIREFSTRGGRKVYDGGGIVPDVKLEPQYFSRFAITLLSQGYVYEWIDKYVREHYNDTIDHRSFKLSEESYADFVDFIADKDVEYESESRRALKALEEALEKDLYDEALQDDLKRFEELIKDDKLSNMQTYRKEIEDILVAEIITRFAYNEGAMENSALKDETVSKAIDLILNAEEYSRILREQNLSMH